MISVLYIMLVLNDFKYYCSNYSDKEKTALINEVKQPEPELSSEKAQLKTYVKQLAGHGNFVWFSAMNLVQVRFKFF